MKLRFVCTTVMLLCLTLTFAYGEERGKGGEKQGKSNEPHSKGGQKPNENKGGGKPPGGDWSEGKQSHGKQSPANHGQANEEKNKSQQGTSAEGAAGRNAAEKNNAKQATGKEGAAAGAAASNRNQPAASGAEGAAAGAAAANRKQPNASGAEGAAAGAAAANRKQPAASGAEGAAAGAAAANRRQPAASGAEGAAVGAAAANRNQPAASGAQGAAVGAAAANRNQPVTSGAVGGVLGAAAVNQNQSATSGAVGTAARYEGVRSSFDHPSLYNEQWHNDHPGAWTASNWPAGAEWTATDMAAVANYCNYANSTPVSYGYGDNVICQNGNVIVDGQNVGTAANFSQQAADLAQVGQNAESSDKDEWLPLGVFALVRNEDQHPQLTLQLAVNKQGILQGNYTDTVTDHTLPIHGAIDKQTQRAAWTVDNNKNFFMEAGVSNLTSGEAPALIHKNSRTEKWLLVRLQQPELVANVDSK